MSNLDLEELLTITQDLLKRMQVLGENKHLLNVQNEYVDSQLDGITVFVSALEKKITKMESIKKNIEDITCSSSNLI